MGLKDIRDIDRRIEETHKKLWSGFDRYLKQPSIQNILHKFLNFPYDMQDGIRWDLSYWVYVAMDDFIKLRPEGIGNPDSVDFSSDLTQFVYNKLEWGYKDIKRKLKSPKVVK